MEISGSFNLVIGNSEPAVDWQIGPVSDQVIPTPPMEEVPMLLLTDIQQVTLRPKFKSKRGNPSKVDGKPTWSVSDPNILTLVVADDGMSALVKASGPEGQCQVVVTADADMGEGVRNINGTMDIEVKASEAVSANLEAGAPEEQPE